MGSDDDAGCQSASDGETEYGRSGCDCGTAGCVSILYSVLLQRGQASATGLRSVFGLKPYTSTVPQDCRLEFGHALHC